MIRCWRLDGAAQTLVLGCHGNELAQVIYWGDPLPDNDDLTALYAAHQCDVTGGMLDENPAISICPDRARNFPGQAGLHIRSADGQHLAPHLLLKDAVQGNDGDLTLIYGDDALGLTYRAYFALDAQTQIITSTAQVETRDPIRLDWLCAPALPAPQNAVDMIDYAGRWCGEFQPNRVPWSPGVRLRDNPTGRSGHEHFPALIIPLPSASYTQGRAYAFHYGWSGGHRMIAEELPDGRRHIQFGHAAGIDGNARNKFETAPLYMTYSNAGLNGCAVAFQRHLRDRIVTWPQPDRPRPVHYNCWEAVYFKHDLDTLKQIASHAADLGAERFVLDDGWFGRRDDDTQSLGDWWVDRRKYPDGLQPLIDHIHDCGMQFGIWFEPEMINEDSDLYRAHPDWVLGPANQIRGRQQLVLNMARTDVRDYLFDRISALLATYPIDYIKWDHNRVLPQPDAAQTYGTYDLLDRLRNAFASTEIESCASGGGRIDFGILQRTQRVWLSDSNDALERLRIQHDAAQFLPMAVTGSHVGPRQCHTSGRVLDIRFRAWVAAQRHMGFEMDPRELTSQEQQVLQSITQWWKTNRDWLFHADILRLDSAESSVLAEQHLAQDGARFVAFIGQAGTSPQILPRPICLTGLMPNARYRVDLINRDDAQGLSRGAPALKTGPLILSGCYLMQQGLNLPWRFPDSMWVLEGTRV